MGAYSFSIIKSL